MKHTALKLIAILMGRGSISAITSGMTKQVSDLRALASLKLNEAALQSDKVGALETKSAIEYADLRDTKQGLYLKLIQDIDALHVSNRAEIEKLEAVQEANEDKYGEQIIAHNEAWEVAQKEWDHATELANKIEKQFSL